MEEQMKKRLEELRAEFELGQKMLTELETRRIEIQQSMLRISGAIQVILEVLSNESKQDESSNFGIEESMTVSV